LLATINRHDLASSNFMSVSSIRMNKCLLISFRECLVLENVIKKAKTPYYS
jgi:hypothetical protein